MIRQTDANGQQVTYDYDPLDRVKTLTYADMKRRRDNSDCGENNAGDSRCRARS
jgi:YD repeat-containing protein